jgi:dienelactone hydrolase
MGTDKIVQAHYLTKKAKIMFIGALCVCFICALGASLVQDSFGKVHVKSYVMTFQQISDRIKVNNQKYNKYIDISFKASSAAQIGFMVLIPDKATEQNRVPCIITCHGGANQKEMQNGNFVELARRGFVVISIDGSGHGDTDVDTVVDPLTHNSHGMEAAVEYAMSLGCVDETNIGVMGHSWGNDSACQSVNAVNLHSKNPKIRAQLIAAGTGYYFEMEKGANTGMVLGILMGKYDEYDTSYFLPTNKQLTSELFKIFFKEICPGYSLDSAPVGEWYTKDGRYSLVPGEKVDATEARILYNPPITHLMVFGTPMGISKTIEFFYGAFGVPSGSSYIPSDRQQWVLMPILSVLGMISLILLILSLIDLLLATPWFAPLARRSDNTVASASIKNWKESVPAILMAVVLIVFTGATIMPLTSDARLVGKWLPSTQLFPVASNQGNAIAIWAIACGVFTLATLLVIYLIKMLLNLKEVSKVVNPFGCARFDSGSQFFRTLFMAFLVTVIAYMPIVFDYYVFHIDFFVFTIGFSAFSLLKVPMIIRYILLLFVFYIANAIVTSNAKFKELPDWVSVAIVAVMNLVGIIVALCIQYYSLFTTGLLKNIDYASTDTVALMLFAGMIFTPIIARYAEKRTNNVWLGAMINSIWFTAALVCNTRYIFLYVLAA